MSIHHDIEAIKMLAIHQAVDHQVNYNIILMNPGEDGAFSFAAGSTYEMVTDSYFEKDRPNVKLLFKTDDLLKVKSDNICPIRNMPCNDSCPVDATCKQAQPKDMVCEPIIFHQLKAHPIDDMIQTYLKPKGKSKYHR